MSTDKVETAVTLDADDGTPSPSPLPHDEEHLKDELNRESVVMEADVELTYEPTPKTSGRPLLF